MLGTAPGMRSGIASVVRIYAAHGLFQRWDAIYLPTHRDEGPAGKLTIALGAWLEVVRRLLLGQVALIHAHVASYASFWRKTLLILPARLVGVPYVLHLHGGAFVDFFDKQSSNGRRAIRFMLRGAARVIALSSEWRDAIARIEPEARIEVIPNPVEIPPWQAALDNRPPSVLFLGMVLERKGIHDLLRVWPDVLAAVPDAELIVAGAGDVDAAKRLAQELSIEPAVRFKGWVEGDAKETLLRRAWVTALPSHVDALPMALLESLAAGVPVVATRVGGIPSVVENERHGLLVPPRDELALSRALIALLVHDPLRKAAGRGARDRAVHEFSSEVVVPRIEALWRDLAPRQEIRTRARAA